MKKSTKTLLVIATSLLAICFIAVAAFMFVKNNLNNGNGNGSSSGSGGSSGSSSSSVVSGTGNDIPDGYIAVFHGGAGEQTYETYIYKQNNGHDNYGFDYVNVTSTTKSWGSSEWESEVTGRGSVQWTDDVFKVAKDNYAYSYVKLPNDDNIYSIDSFAEMFLMN